MIDIAARLRSDAHSVEAYSGGEVLLEAADEIERLRASNADLMAALDEAAEALERYSDVRDGPDGQPVPNAAMTALETVRAAIAKARTA